MKFQASELLLAWTGVSGFHVLLVFLRVGSAMALLPAFGEQVVPARIKLAAALSFTLILVPLVEPQNHGSAVLAAAGEVVAGLTLGFALRILVLALQIAGTLIASATSLAQIFGGGVGSEPQPAIGTLMVVSGLALATSLGLHVRVVEALVFSYALLPIGILPDPQDLAGYAVADVARAFSFAFSLAAPFTVAALLYNLALGVINRAMPQLMVSFVGAPALTFGGLLLLVLSLPFALAIWLKALDATLSVPLLGEF